MRRTIYELEDKQEVLDRDVKEIARRLYEKEEYLRELSLFKPGNSIEEAEKMDQKLTETKQLYKENFDVSLSVLFRCFRFETSMRYHFLSLLLLHFPRFLRLDSNVNKF